MTQKMKYIMTPNPYRIGIHEKIFAALKSMAEHDIHHLAVMNGDDLEGLITDRDIELVLDVKLEGLKYDSITVQDVMFEEPYIVDVDESLIRVLEYFSKNHIGTALVTENEQLVGIFTASDACKELLKRIKYEDSSSP
ncbi:MAG: CBS domain-containing protein [Gammaproteobacteria bacterium]|jgi:CBS domain-containing protein